jgi:hypothetical protein
LLGEVHHASLGAKEHGGLDHEDEGLGAGDQELEDDFVLVLGCDFDVLVLGEGLEGEFDLLVAVDGSPLSGLGDQTGAFLLAEVAVFVDGQAVFVTFQFL